MGDVTKSYAKISGYAVSLDAGRNWAKRLYTDPKLPHRFGLDRACQTWNDYENENKFFPHISFVRGRIEGWCRRVTARNAEIGKPECEVHMVLAWWKISESDPDKPGNRPHTLTLTYPRESGSGMDVKDPQLPSGDYYFMYLISASPRTNAAEEETPDKYSRGDPTDDDKVLKEVLLSEEIPEEEIVFKTWVYDPTNPWPFRRT